MSTNIKIPLGEGINKQTNPTMKPVEEVENLYVDIEEGSYVKRTGMGGNVDDTDLHFFTATGKLFRDLKYWIDTKTEELYFLGWDYANKFLYRYKTSDFLEETIVTGDQFGTTKAANQLVGTTHNCVINDLESTDVQTLKYFFKVTTIPNYPSSDGWSQPTGVVVNGTPPSTLQVNADNWNQGVGPQFLGDGTVFRIWVKEASYVGGGTAGVDQYAFAYWKPDGTYQGTYGPRDMSTSFHGSGDFVGIEIKFSQTTGHTHLDEWYFKINDKHRISVSTDDVSYTNEQVMPEALTTLEGTNGLKAKWTDQNLTTTALNDKWEFEFVPTPPIVKPINWGLQIRVPFGPYIRPMVYQHIKRGYFWLGDGFAKEVDEFHLDETPFPRTPQTWFYESLTALSGGELTADKNYYYKMVPVFDGDQEGLLEDDYIVQGTTATNKKLQLKFQINLEDINKRLTGLKLYRASTSSGTPSNGEYKFIKGYSISESLADVYTINTATGYLGEKIIRQGDWDTTALFRDVNTGLWGQSAEYLNPTQTTTTFTNTFTVPKDNAIEADFAVLESADPTNLDSWGSTGNVWLYDALGNQVVNPDVTSTTYWTDTHGGDSAIQTWTLGAARDSSSNAFTVTYMENIISSNNWVDITTSVSYIDMGSNANVFYIDYEWSSATYPPSNNAYSRVRIDVYRDGSLIATKRTPSSATLNGSLAQRRVEQNAIKFENVAFLTTDQYKVTFEAKWSGSSSGSYGVSVGLNNIYVRKGYTNGDCSNQYRHKNAMAVINASVFANQLVGTTITVNDGTGADDFVCDSHPVRDMWKCDFDDQNPPVATTGWLGGDSDANNTIQVSSAAYENLGNNIIRINYIDSGELDGSYHQNAGTSSLDTRYRYSEALGGRNFVGNVQIVNSLGVAENYDDMVMFSEVGQPDVIPISNFIKLNDLQGGRIFGLSSILSDLIVFAERGIFRVSIPTTDPTGWSVVEAEPNIGCEFPRTIVKYENGVFFCGHDCLYYIDSNFIFYNLTKQWKEDYLTFIPTNGLNWDIFAHIDNINKRLHLCKNNQQTFYTLSLKKFQEQKVVWNENTITTSTSRAEADSIRGMFEDNLLNTIVSTKDNGNTGNSYFKNIEGHKVYESAIDFDGDGDIDVIDQNTNSYVYNEGANVKCKFVSGWIRLTKLNKRNSVIIRRINLDLETLKGFTIKIYLDTDGSPGSQTFFETTVADSLYTDNKIRSIRVGRRARRCKIEISQAESTYTFKLRSLELEVG